MKDKTEQFLRSALSPAGAFHDMTSIRKWLQEQKESIPVRVKKIPFRELEHWSFSDSGLRHESGKFFSAGGFSVKSDKRKIEWDQPMIIQPEIGYLGFITKEFNGILHFLVQAKAEPGNVNDVQLSPTLQATRSNYTKVHKGKEPGFLNYFLNASQATILLDQLQSEQGSRFYKKRNRTIILKTEEEIVTPHNYTWLTLGQIKTLMQENNVVNMNTRTSIGGILFSNGEASLGEKMFDWQQCSINATGFLFLDSVYAAGKEKNSFDDILHFIAQKKFEADLSVEKIPLQELRKWKTDEFSISHEENKHFKIIAVAAEIQNREVVQWTQPMIEPVQQGLCAFVCKLIHGILHIAMQAKSEAGNFDMIELAPTVQTTAVSLQLQKEHIPFLDLVLQASPGAILIDTVQSEEGGRFFREQNRYMVLLAGDELSEELPDDFIWMTLGQLQQMIRLNNHVNIQARSLVAAIPFFH